MSAHYAKEHGVKEVFHGFTVPPKLCFAMVPTPKDARELIAFYLDAGVDALLGEEPVDRFADEAHRTSP